MGNLLVNVYFEAIETKNYTNGKFFSMDLYLLIGYL